MPGPTQQLQYIPLRVPHMQQPPTTSCGDLEATPAMLHGGSQQHFRGGGVWNCSPPLILCCAATT